MHILGVFIGRRSDPVWGTARCLGVSSLLAPIVLLPRLRKARPRSVHHRDTHTHIHIYRQLREQLSSLFTWLHKRKHGARLRCSRQPLTSSSCPSGSLSPPTANINPKISSRFVSLVFTCKHAHPYKTTLKYLFKLIYSEKPLLSQRVFVNLFP